MDRRVQRSYDKIKGVSDTTSIIESISDRGKDVSLFSSVQHNDKLGIGQGRRNSTKASVLY